MCSERFDKCAPFSTIDAMLKVNEGFMGSSGRLGAIVSHIRCYRRLQLLLEDGVPVSWLTSSLLVYCDRVFLEL